MPMVTCASTVRTEMPSCAATASVSGDSLRARSRYGRALANTNGVLEEARRGRRAGVAPGRPGPRLERIASPCSPGPAPLALPPRPAISSPRGRAPRGDAAPSAITPDGRGLSRWHRAHKPSSRAERARPTDHDASQRPRHRQGTDAPAAGGAMAGEPAKVTPLWLPRPAEVGLGSARRSGDPHPAHLGDRHPEPARPHLRGGSPLAPPPGPVRSGPQRRDRPLPRIPLAPRRASGGSQVRERLPRRTLHRGPRPSRSCRSGRGALDRLEALLAPEQREKLAALAEKGWHGGGHHRPRS
jgi:hypothetical protein